MATVYTKREAIGRAVERAMSDIDTFCVWGNNYGDFIVKVSSHSPPRGFKKIFTVEPKGGDKAAVFKT